MEERIKGMLRGGRKKSTRMGTLVRPWGDLHIGGTLKVWGKPHGEDYFNVDSCDVGIVVGTMRWGATQYYQVVWRCGVGWVHGGMVEALDEKKHGEGDM